MAQITPLGIRHHGPGSARAVRRALAELRPDVILIEGPPEADALVPLAADPGMVPPVALLAYCPATSPATSPAGSPAGDDRRAAFWPFAEFSPEWVAVQHGLHTGVPVRFCDLPAAHQLADPPAPPAETGPGPAAAGEGPGQDAAGGEEAGGPLVRIDPLGWLAEAAGYADAERWWEDVVEHRGDGPSAFEAIGEAMAELRGHAPQAGPERQAREEQREAYMRRVLRRAVKDGYQRIAVVCGAWHVPAIHLDTTAAADDRILRGLPKVKVELTWVPWTHGRLAGWSGYGAGVESPGWYHHLFTAPDRPIERWLTAAARLLRAEDLPVSSAHVIEAVRLAESLATLRDRPLAGLDEVTEAARAVLCEGAELPLELIQRRMVVGERLGAVPDSTPMVPLQQDLRAEQKRLRLPAAALDKEYRLDLRKPADLDRSRLLHRLRLLGIGWGVPGDSGSKGTFRETWTVAWRPEFDVEAIEASVWGTTVAGAAAGKAVDEAAALAAGGALADLTALAERCLLADLADALPPVMRAVADRATADTDTVHLMAALPPLVRALRYGDVRGTPVGPLRTVVDALATRIGIGLPLATGGLDDDAARLLLKHVDQVNAALALLDDDAHTAAWRDTLHGLLDRRGLHGLLDGRLTRLLHDAGHLTDIEPRLTRAVSPGHPPARTAAWIEGFLSGGGLILVHDTDLLRLVDAWVAGLSADAFTDVLPLLRRTFAEFQPPERRSIGDRVRGLTAAAAPRAVAQTPLDPARADPAARAVLAILTPAGPP